MSEPGRAVTRLSRSDRRAQLLGAAREVFVSVGYHAAVMDDIAERAGVSKPVLYQHFSSKLDLYLALLNDSVDDLIATVRQAIDSTADNRERVHLTIGAYYEFVSHNSQAYRLIFESDVRADAAVQAAVDRASDKCVEILAETIAQDTGADPAAARLLASGLTGLSQVSARYWLAQDDKLSKDDAVSMLSTLAWRGISRFPRHN